MRKDIGRMVSYMIGIGMLFLTGILGYMHACGLHYEYYYICDVKKYILHICMVLGPTTIVACIYWIRCIWRRRGGQLLFAIGYFIVFCCSLLISFELSFSPTYYSHTTEWKYLGKYDEWAYVSDTFPEKIPETVEDIQYSYSYMDSSEKKCYIAVSWVYTNDEDMEKEIAKLKNAMAWKENDNGELLLYGKGRVIFDLAGKRVYYISSNMNDLPQYGAEVFEWSLG